mmetsp:Transcript_15599/g.40351  ORF Transcript_15599/g.40351 Transcript_15599/m.40351 type:complete len:208 (-) Transcript_15599:110-733(-)
MLPRGHSRRTRAEGRRRSSLDPCKLLASALLAGLLALAHARISRHEPCRFERRPQARVEALHGRGDAVPHRLRLATEATALDGRHHAEPPRRRRLKEGCEHRVPENPVATKEARDALLVHAHTGHVSLRSGPDPYPGHRRLATAGCIRAPRSVHLNPLSRCVARGPHVARKGGGQLGRGALRGGLGSRRREWARYRPEDGGRARHAS